jgi:hypothetical protein
MRYCKFEDERGEAVVFMNPAAVRYLRAEPGGLHTRIVFDDSQSITVKSIIDDVVMEFQDGIRISWIVYQAAINYICPIWYR